MKRVPEPDATGADDPGAVLGMAAHELKNALGPLVLSLQMLEQRAAAGGRIEAAEVAQARTHLRRLTRMVEDLCEASASDGGQLAVRLEPADLRAITEEAIAAARTASGRPLSLYLPDAPVPVRADTVRLEGVLLNLVDNAVKYSPADGAVEISLVVDGGWARVSVKDQGPGVSAADRARLFQRHFRAAATAGKTRGLGLGLYLCRAVVERHGGALGLDSELGNGSTFWFELPIAASPPED